MRKLQKLVLPLIASSLLFPMRAVPQQATQPSTASTVGSTIGTIVKSAIQTAFPAVGTILSSILSASPQTKNKTDNQNVTVGAVKAAASTPAAAQSVQQQITAAIQPKLAPLSQVAGELAVINQFLLPSTNASRALFSIQADLGAATPNWNDVSLQWSIAQNQLQKVKAITDTQINSVSDLWLRNQLTTIRNANDAPSLIIAAGVKNKDKAGVIGAVQQLTPVLDGMSAAAGYELANMQADISALANWARGAGGTTRAPNNPFKALVTKDLSDAK